MSFPCDVVHSVLGWGRMHQGHGLDREVLRKDLSEAGRHWVLSDGQWREIQTCEVHMQPRQVMWCSQDADFPCQLNGVQLHEHWVRVFPNADAALQFTQVFWHSPHLVDMRGLGTAAAVIAG
ncbi:Uncharacterised protein [Mycobacteroides abscessus subsp. abscessus]|uniref:hypothetical protein n=1 Tax=Mycobacteroides abscessus TaxID=36809 RepID=UPI00092686DF|nr:hypothetical protein [Mycobacteroides abscessus]SIH20941.1 Uncharacterised protein [Mycobacteroides abscessus subsp. abscessus]